MTETPTTLADRRDSLLQRSAAQRDDLAKQLGAVNARLGRIDNGLEAVRRWITGPWAIGVALPLILALGRRGSLKTVGAGLGLLSTVLRIGRLGSRKRAKESVDVRQ